MNKKGVELSINFTVILILAIAMFAGGMMIVGKFFTGAQQMKATLDSQTDRQIEALLDSGQPFVIPVFTKEVHRNEHTTFGVGVYNDGRPSTKMPTQFKIHVKGISGDEGITVQGSDESVTLSPGEKNKFLLLFQVDNTVPKGSYVYEVELTSPNNYEPSLQIIVKVI